MCVRRKSLLTMLLRSGKRGFGRFRNGTGCVLALRLCAIVCLASFPADPRVRNDTPEPAPIIERRLDVMNFSFKTFDGQPFDLRDYLQKKRVVVVAFVAGWCPNSNRNGHILKRLYDKYRDRGLGTVVVMEYSDPREINVHIARIGIDYPLVVETRRRGQRKDSLHYKYRRQVGDERKWGTPFYMMIDSRDLEAGSVQPITRRAWTVSGEIVESEAEAFIESRMEPYPARSRTRIQGSVPVQNALARRPFGTTR